MTARAKETRRYRRAWRPTSSPYGYEDLPGHVDAVETTVHDGLFATVTVESVGHRAHRALTWRYDHPRDRTAIAVLRDPASMPTELGWRVAHAMHDDYQLSNDLLHSHPGICSTCDPAAHAALTKKYACG